MYHSKMTGTCSIAGCGRPSKARGWCYMHWKRWRLSGDPGTAGPRHIRGGRICKVEGCGLRAHAKDLCNTHHARFQRLGYAGEVERWILVRNGRTDAEMFDAYCGRSDDPTACWPWQGRLGNHGYGVLGGGDDAKLAHVLSWEIHHGAVPDGQCVLHTCDFRPCCRPDHLFLGSHADNSADMVEKDRQHRGERHCFAKLTDAAVLTIRASSKSQHELAVEFGVHPATIRDAVTGKTWKHLARPAR